MARPLRVQFPGAWYHVMNRGAGRRLIYPTDSLRRSFLELLDDVYERFALEVHAWCLMDNHYHLVCRTPEPNLDRAMRHVDGVYTQRHNRRTGTDGALFRGRYKAILVDSDNYLSQLTRYIHRNPVDAGMVAQAQAWRWSSYRSYLGTLAKPKWLFTQTVLGLFHSDDDRTARIRHRTFVEHGVDSEIKTFYARDPVPPVLGSKQFCAKILGMLDKVDSTEVPELRRCHRRPDIRTIVETTAAAFCVSPDDITAPSRGRRNLPRVVAMSLCQSPGGYTLKTIANAFGVRSYNGVSAAIGRLRKQSLETGVKHDIACIKTRLFGPV